MPITHNLNLKSRNLGSETLLTWDRLHNAHGYRIFKSGIQYLDVENNRSLALPTDSYQVYAKTWQNDESLSYVNIIPNFDYVVRLNFNYLNYNGVSTPEEHYFAGKFNPRQKIQLAQKVIYRNYVKFDYRLSLSILSINTNNLNFRITPRIKVIANLTNTHRSLINLPSSDLTINF